MFGPSKIKYTTRAIERWFAANQRPLPWRESYDPYEVWVSEVMLQQTRMEVVLGYFERFMTRFPTIKRLASSSVDNVLAMWSGLGYYRRARMVIVFFFQAEDGIRDESVTGDVCSSD